MRGTSDFVLAEQHHILSAAVKLLSQGNEILNRRQLAKEAGVPIAILQRYFRCMADLRAALGSFSPSSLVVHAEAE